ncbi:hypothetical protein DIPPA_01128 [Diplonema papillatum]|nr:hypothetical protein DIPPA_01128 [Diplonema papillatum]
MFSRVMTRSVRPLARAMTVPAEQFKSEKDPSFLEFQATSWIENLYEFQVKNIADYNTELRKLADLKANDTLKSTFEVLKSKLIIPDSTTIEIVMKSAEPSNLIRAIRIFDDVIKFELDPSAETYKTIAGVAKAAGNNEIATLATAMAKDEDRYGSERMVKLVALFHQVAAKN